MERDLGTNFEETWVWLGFLWGGWRWNDGVWKCLKLSGRCVKLQKLVQLQQSSGDFIQLSSESPKVLQNPRKLTEFLKFPSNLKTFQLIPIFSLSLSNSLASLTILQIQQPLKQCTIKIFFPIFLMNCVASLLPPQPHSFT
jgi:hypothetical protein